MKATTMLDTIRSLLGAPACAIPLSVCRPAKTYLLEKAGIPPSGTAVLFAIPYVMTREVSHPQRNISLYAVPRDYHGYTKELEAHLLPSLRAAYPDKRFALFADHSPIQEADAAARAGLGSLGLNRLLITPDHGSLVFLAEIVTDGDYTEVTGRPIPDFPDQPPRCEGCGACIKACPGGCLSGETDTCLSALTQKKSELTDTEINAVRKGGLAWGCDACQLACPHNRAVIREGRDTAIPYFTERRLPHLTQETLEAMSDEALSERAYAWRGRKVIARNLSFFVESEPTNNREDREDREDPAERSQPS